jgi:hypothetical protein
VISRFLAVLAVLLAAATATQAQTLPVKPPVPPGAPTRGPAVALLTTGIDYRRPEIARRLARDGEGDLIGFDTIDRDPRPFGEDAAANRLVELSPALIVPIRVAPADPAMLAAALAFVRRTPARMVVVPFPLRETAAIARAVDEARDLLFIAAAGDDGIDLDAAPADARPLKRDHVIVVGALAAHGSQATPNRGARALDLVLVPPAAARERPGGSADPPATSPEAAVMLAGAFACTPADFERAASPADVKRILIAKATRARTDPTPLLEVCDPQTRRR